MPADPTPARPAARDAVRPNPPGARAPRLPGTYAANFESDMNWRRGVAVLWVLFILIALGEAMLAAFILLQGRPCTRRPWTRFVSAWRARCSWRSGWGGDGCAGRWRG